MAISYNGLWKLMIDKNLKRVDLMRNKNINISSSTLVKMGKEEPVSLSVLCKICKEYGCDFGDIISYKEDKKGGKNINETNKM